MREYDASHGKKAASDLANLTGIIFRANALSRVFAKYSTRADEFRAALQAASDAALEAALETADIAAGFAVGAAHSAAEAAAGAVSAAHSAAEAAGAYPADAADPVGADYPASIVWRAIRSDIDSILSRGAEPRSIYRCGHPGRLNARATPGRACARSCQATRTGRSGLTGTRNAFEAGREARTTNSSSRACRRRNGTRDRRRLTRGSRRNFEGARPTFHARGSISTTEIHSRNGSKGRSRMFRSCSRPAQPCASYRPPSVLGARRAMRR